MVDINSMTRVTDDSEMQMAKSDLYNLAKNSVELYKLIKDLPELEGWTQAKITKAADYIGSVLNYMKYEAREQRMDLSEMASSGGTSSGAIATAPMPMGKKKKKVIKRVQEEEVWDKPNPVKKHKKLSPAQKSKAKARAKAAGRKYPNMVDNIWAAKN